MQHAWGVINQESILWKPSPPVTICHLHSLALTIQNRFQGRSMCQFHRSCSAFDRDFMGLWFPEKTVAKRCVYEEAQRWFLFDSNKESMGGSIGIYWLDLTATAGDVGGVWSIDHWHWGFFVHHQSIGCVFWRVLCFEGFGTCSLRNSQELTLTCLAAGKHLVFWPHMLRWDQVQTVCWNVQKHLKQNHTMQLNN